MFNLKPIWNYILMNVLPFILLTILIILLIIYQSDKLEAIALSLTVWIFTYELVKEKGDEFENYKRDLKSLYEEYKENIEYSIVIEQTDINKIKELSFNQFRTNFINRVIKNNLIRDKNLLNKLNDDLIKLIWFNKVWFILAKQVLLKENLDSHLKEQIESYLGYEKKHINTNLIKNVDLIKKYYKKEFIFKIKE